MLLSTLEFWLMNPVHVYTAFRAAFSLVSLMGLSQLLFVNVLTYGEEVFFICLDKHVSCPCLHDSSIFKCVFFFRCCTYTFSFDMMSNPSFPHTWPAWTWDSLQTQAPALTLNPHSSQPCCCSVLLSTLCAAVYADVLVPFHPARGWDWVSLLFIFPEPNKAYSGHSTLRGRDFRGATWRSCLSL